MPINDILINVADVPRAAAFYAEFLGLEPVGEATADEALLDAVTATIRLRRIDPGASSTWTSDDLQKGFRHVGFKVDRVDPIAEKLKAAGVRFQLDPLNAEGEVRITFFYDPDGTILELVEGDLQYHEVVDQAGVDSERALGVPARPRFDHVATTVADLPETEAFYAPFGFGNIGTIHQPHDPRGFNINYLKGGDTVLEIFTYDRELAHRDPQLDAPGFVRIRLEGDAVPDAAVAVGEAVDGSQVVADSDGLTFAVGR